MSIILKNEAEKNIEHTIIIYAKNIFGILERILNVFSEKLIAIESINSILLEKQGKYKIIIISKFKKEYIVKIIEKKKQIDSDEIEYYKESQLIYNELTPYGLIKFNRSGKIVMTKN